MWREGVLRKIKCQVSQSKIVLIVIIDKVGRCV